MSSPDRQELLRNAVVFLQDPKVRDTVFLDTLPDHLEQTQASPLTQRIQFLEAKGLTPVEIDMAIKQSSTNATPPNYQNGYTANYSAAPYPMAPPRAQGWDWRDYFASLVLS